MAYLQPNSTTSEEATAFDHVRRAFQLLAPLHCQRRPRSAKGCGMQAGPDPQHPSSTGYIPGGCQVAFPISRASLPPSTTPLFWSQSAADCSAHGRFSQLPQLALPGGAHSVGGEGSEKRNRPGISLSYLCNGPPAAQKLNRQKGRAAAWSRGLQRSGPRPKGWGAPHKKASLTKKKITAATDSWSPLRAFFKKNPF